MKNVPAKQQGYPGQETPYSGNVDLTAVQFAIKSAIARIPGAHLVVVRKVSTQGQVGPVGSVDIEPMVNMMDGQGNTTPHGVIHNIPYFRLQGGGDKAVIMDPKVGDIGVAVFANRDISGVKRSKKPGPPGSYRRHDMADGLYIGGFLGGEPMCYIRFTDDNKIIGAVGKSNPYQWVVASDHVQMKKKGDPTMHITLYEDKIVTGKAMSIEPDPFPGD